MFSSRLTITTPPTFDNLMHTATAFRFGQHATSQIRLLATQISIFKFQVSFGFIVYVFLPHGLYHILCCIRSKDFSLRLRLRLSIHHDLFVSFVLFRPISKPAFHNDTSIVSLCTLVTYFCFRVRSSLSLYAHTLTFLVFVCFSTSLFSSHYYLFNQGLFLLPHFCRVYIRIYVGHKITDSQTPQFCLLVHVLYFHSFLSSVDDLYQSILKKHRRS